MGLAKPLRDGILEVEDSRKLSRVIHHHGWQEVTAKADSADPSSKPFSRSGSIIAYFVKNFSM
jgi:hypothetical protein